MSLPLRKRYEIVFHAKNKYGPQFGSNKIAKIVKCNRKAVTHWLKRWEETNELAYNLINSMERRVQSLIDSSGDYTLY